MTESNVSQLPERRSNQPPETTNLPAVTAPPTPAEWTAMKQQAQVIYRSGMAPRSIKSAEQVLVIALKGRELRLPPMQALSHIHVVEGKPTLSAELMAALVQRAGHRLRVIETSAEKCVVEGERADDRSQPQRVTWTMADATRAGVANKGPWKSYPAAMLRARAISALCRFAFADVLMGASYTPEELGADVDEEGNIVEAEPVHEPAVEAEAEAQVEEAEAQVEEAEVVDEEPVREEPAPDFEPGGILPAQRARIENLSEWIWGEKRAVEDSPILKGHRIEELTPDSAKGVINGLQKTKERMQAAQQQTEQPSEEVAVADDPTPHPDEVEGVERGGAARKDPGDLPATRKQLNYLEALVVDIDERGVEGLEEMVGKPIGELTREEASDWIGRLAGREA